VSDQLRTASSTLLTWTDLLDDLAPSWWIQRRVVQERSMADDSQAEMVVAVVVVSSIGGSSEFLIIIIRIFSLFFDSGRISAGPHKVRFLAASQIPRGAPQNHQDF
jgi:hypothetical protein